MGRKAKKSVSVTVRPEAVKLSVLKKALSKQDSGNEDLEKKSLLC